MDQAPPAQPETGLSSRGAQEVGRGTQGRLGGGVMAPSFSPWRLLSIPLLQIWSSPHLSCRDYCKRFPTATSATSSLFKLSSVSSELILSLPCRNPVKESTSLTAQCFLCVAFSAPTLWHGRLTSVVSDWSVSIPTHLWAESLQFSSGETSLSHSL